MRVIVNVNGASDGTTEQDTFVINVPVVRPDHETTAFIGWSGTNPTFGEWQQTLVTPSDPTFDFSGEHVYEFAAGQAGPDMCYFEDSATVPFDRSKIRPINFGLCNLVTFLIGLTKSAMASPS